MKKHLTILLVIILFVGIFPAEVFAPPGGTPSRGGQVPRLQAPVSDPRMIVTGTNGNMRTFRIDWDRPGLSHNTYNSGLAMDELYNTPPTLETSPTWFAWTHYPIEYRIQFRNATRNERWNETVDPFTFNTNLSQQPEPFVQRLNTTLTRTMRQSSLYQIQVLPYNEVPRLDLIPTGNPLAPSRRTIARVQAPIDENHVPGQRDIIYLTDVQIDMQNTYGHGNSITVEWFNPTFNGLNVFDEWIVSFMEFDQTDPNRSIEQHGVTRVVPISEIDVLPGGRLRYTVSHVEIVPMRLYNVSVEPRRMGRRIRPIVEEESNPREPFAMPDGKLYNFAFSPVSAMEFRTTSPVLMTPELHLEIIGADLVRLWWARFEGIAGEIERIELEEWYPQIYGRDDPYADMSDRVRILTTIEGHVNIANMTELILGPNFPRDVRAFTLAIYVKGATDPAVRTNPVLYDPTYVDFAPYRPEIIELGAQVISPTMGVLSPLQFQAFTRAPYVLEEEPLVNQLPHSEYNPAGTTTPRIIDLQVLYEIYVADSWETLEMMTEPLIIRDPAALRLVRHQSNLNVVPPAYDPSWVLTEPITEFYIRTETGLERRTIEGNRVYYVKLRAVRDDPGNQSSLWAYGSVFMPPFDGIPAIPEMISAPPITITDQRDTEIDIAWPLRYLEIEQPRATDYRDIWHSMVGVTPNGRVIYGRSAEQITNAEDYRDNIDGTPRYAILNNLLPPRDLNSLLGEGQLPLDLTSPSQVGAFLQGPAMLAVNNFLTGLGADTTTTPTALRIQNMVGKQYEIHVVEYDYMMATGSMYAINDEDPFEIYRAMFLQNPTIQNMWERITPTIAAGMGSYTVSSAHAPNRGALRPNKNYVIFIRPYEMTSEGLKVSYYPTFVVGGTVTHGIRPIPDPTTPVLFPVEEFITDSSIGVRWRVQDNVGFELDLSERMPEYPNSGFLLPPPLTTQAEIDEALNDPDIPFEIRTMVQNGVEVPFYFLRIDGLFPDTTYYVWAYAYGLDENGEVATNPSQPSNPVDMRTLDILPPRPPSIAPAPSSLLNIYNRLNDTEYKADEPTALNILLTRIFADMETGAERAESGTASGGPVEPINLPTDVYSRLHILRFTELVANKPYFVRARTILTVQRSGAVGGPVEKTYSYEIQVANNEDFLDPIIYVIPTAPEVNENSVNVRRAVSEWVWFEISTGRSADEYDGPHDPEQYPLPDQDWEITYDPLTQTLTWRFRTNRTDSDGNLDQNVDQRFISRLISEQTFVYDIDMSQYQGNPITNRVVEIPKSIIGAFDERLITFRVLTGDITYSVPPRAFDTAAVRDLQLAPRDFFRVNLNGNPQNMPELTTNTSFSTVPQRLSVTAHTGMRQITMETFAAPLDIVLSVDNNLTPVGVNTGLYQSGSNISGWQDMNAQFTFGANNIAAQTQRPATFAGITRNAPPSAVQDPSMERVTSRLNITDLTSYEPSRQVTANEFNNIVNAIVRNNSTVTIGANLSADHANALSRARLYATDLNLETALDIMVRLYENKTQQILTPKTPASSIPGLQNATPSTHNNLRIAADLGFITGPLEPNARLTMGELMNMVDIIIQDAGM
ncbi:MAG: hypothetical protein LBI27_00245 [Clostridiales bacterium]|jgi:hypothetical protein|nr:hypothetical protein [Clostridiales bacterium]